MINLKLTAAGAAISLLGLPAHAAVIDFSNTNCVATGTTCLIPQTYGDTADVDVSYRAFNVSNGQTSGVGLFHFTAGYGNLTDVVYGGTDMTHFGSEITLTAKPGRLLSLRDFDFATWGGRSRQVPISVLDLAGNLLMGGNYSTSYPGHSTLSVNSDFLPGVIIRWGPDGYNVGLDNIDYTIKSAAPETATWAMMVVGFGALGTSLRARRREVTFA